MRNSPEVVQAPSFPQPYPGSSRAEGKSREELAAQKAEFQRLGPRIRRQRAVAPRVCDDLLSQLPERQVALIRGCYTKFRSRPLAEELLRRGQQLVRRNPRECLRLGGLAWEIATRLPGMHDLAGGLAGVNDLKAQIRAHEGNANRVLGFPSEAKTYLDQAFSYLSQGTGSPEAETTPLIYYSSILRLRRRYPEALGCMDRAEALNLEVGDEDFRARLLLQRGATLQEMGAVAAAMPALRKAQGLFRSRLFRGMAHQVLALTCYEAGRFDEAAEALEDADKIFRHYGPEIDGLQKEHRTWIRGKVSQGVRRFSAAESLYRTAKDSFLHKNHTYDAALVSLDLATLFCEQRRFRDLAIIADKTCEEIRNHPLHPETEAALLAFVEAARRRRVTTETIRNAVFHVKYNQNLERRFY